MKYWLSLIISLPTENANARMRSWRALKASGAAVLRDGVYLMPEQDGCRATLEAVAEEVRAAAGTAYVLRVEEPEGAAFAALFDRSGAYASLLEEVRALQAGVSADPMADPMGDSANVTDVTKRARKLRRAFAAIAAIDFFGCEAQRQTDAALQALELALARALSPDEPQAVDAAIARLALKGFQAKTWATRQRPWVDRLACAWLIRSQIDPQARFVWLPSPQQCPKNAIGFDFDGARFSHVGARVTFEVLLASFGLETAALQRLGHLVHFLDVGGVPPPEASGIESVLAGMRDSIADDDLLLQAASAVFDGLHSSFLKEGANRGKP